MSPFSKNGASSGKLTEDEHFPEWWRQLPDLLGDLCNKGKFTLGITAVFAGINHHANAEPYDPKTAATFFDWAMQESGKHIGYQPDNFPHAMRVLAGKHFDDLTLATTRKLLGRPADQATFDRLCTEAKKAAQAFAIASEAVGPEEHQPAAEDEDDEDADTSPAARGKKTSASQRSSSEGLAAAAAHQPTVAGNIGKYFSRLAYVLHGLLEHFAPRGATGIAFLVVNVVNKLQDAMASTADNKSPAVIDHKTAQVATACDAVGTATLSLGTLAGIVMAAVLASGDGPLSETGSHLLSNLNNETDLNDNNTLIDISEVHSAIHARRQVIEQAGKAVKGSSQGKNRSHGFLGRGADDSQRPPKPTTPPDAGREWAWGNVTQKWYQQKKDFKAAALRATTDADEPRIHEAAAEAAQQGRTTFVVDDRAFRILDGSLKELSNYSKVFSTHDHALHTSPILDSGAQSDMMPPQFMAGKLRSAHTKIIGVGGALPASEVKSGHAEFTTTDARGHATTISLPAALTHKGIKAPLVSMHKLLERGYKVTLGLGAGTVTTPQGAVIHLVVRNRLWCFPAPPPRATSHATRPPKGIPTSPNPFQALAHDAPSQEPSSSGNVATRSATAKSADSEERDRACRQPKLTPATPKLRPALRTTGTRGGPAKTVQWHHPIASSRGPVSPTQASPPPSPARHGKRVSPMEFHRQNLHAHGEALVKIRAQRIAEDDTAEAHLPSAAELRQIRCTDCSGAAMRKPPTKLTHPRRSHDHDSEMRPGEFLNIDLLGRLDNPQIGFRPPAGQEILILTDSASSAKTYMALPDKSSPSVLFAIQEWTSKSPILPKRITCDSEISTAEIRAWATPLGIDVVACPPHEHASNGRAESAVGFGKAKTATLRQTGGADESFIALTLEWIGIQSSFIPSKGNTTGTAPVDVWPHIPFLHHRHRLRHDLPLFCLCYRATDATQGDSNLSRRGKACIFLGWSRTSESYRLLDLETHRIIDGRRVTFHEDIFPLKDRQRAGEALPSREPFFVDGTRTLGNIEIKHATDEQLATYCALKSISATWPSTSFPKDAPHCWGFRAHRHIPPSQTTLKVNAIDVQVTTFSGTSDDMHDPADNQYHQRPYLFAIPVTHTGSGDDMSLRSAISFCFPSAIRLWDIAEQSAARLNRLHQPTIRAQHVTPWCPGVDPPSTPASSLPSRKELRRMAAAERRAGSRRTSTRAPPATGSHFVRTTWCLSAICSPPGDRATPRQSMVKPDYSASSMLFDHEHLDQTSFGLLSETEEEGEGKVGFEPKNIREAKAHPSWPRWQAAIDRENQGLLARGTYTRMHRKDVPNGVQLLHSMYTFKDKTVSKARLVVHGHRQRPSPPPTETHASTPSSQVIRMLTSLTAANRHKTRLIDVKQAFVQSDDLPAGSKLYMVPPPEAEADRDIVWHLRKPLYGLKCAPRAWANTLRKFLEGEGWQSVAHEDTLFQLNKGKARMALVFHVDDILLSYNEAATAAADAFTQALLNRFEAKDEGEVQRYLGVDFTRHDDGSISLSQEPLVLGLLDRFQLLDCNPVSTPLPPGINLSTQDSPKNGPNRDLAGKFREVVGTLQYLATWTRPDIAHATHVLSRHSSNPGEVHWTAASHVMRYLKGTSHLGLRYHATPSQDSPPHTRNKLFGYCDSDWGSDIDTRRSVGAHLVFLNGAAISWRSKLQTSTALSTCEAEFYAASRLANEVLWLRRIIAALGYDQGSATPVFEDNRAVLLLAANPVHREKMKHVDISLHNLRDNVANGTVNLLACPTADMTADCLTKALPKPAFVRHREVMLGNAPHTSPPPFMAAHLAILAS
jgi:hypothetical protein